MLSKQFVTVSIWYSFSNPKIPLLKTNILHFWYIHTYPIHLYSVTEPPKATKQTNQCLWPQLPCQRDIHTKFADNKRSTSKSVAVSSLDILLILSSLSEGPWEGIGLACLLYHPTDLASLAVLIATLLLLAPIVPLPLQLKQLKQYNSHWGAASPPGPCVFVDNL